MDQGTRSLLFGVLFGDELVASIGFTSSPTQHLLFTLRTLRSSRGSLLPCVAKTPKSFRG